MYQGVVLDFLNMGGGEIALIMVAVLLLFGGKKLPELARGLGKGIREFKDASEGVKREIHRNINSVTTEVEDAKEELNHSDYHHPTEDQNVHAAADEVHNSSEVEEDLLKTDENEDRNPHHLKEEEEVPVKGKESHIE